MRVSSGRKDSRGARHKQSLPKASQQVRQNWICYFKYEEQATAVMGNKKRRRKGLEQQQRALFEFQRVFKVMPDITVVAGTVQ